MKPLIVINLKTYKSGDAQVKLAKDIESVDKNIILGAPATDLYLLSKKTNLTIYAEHVDSYEPGRNTGFILPEAVKSVGAKGVFLNHSEHPLDIKTIKKTIERCKKINLKTMVFAENLRFAKKIEKFKPDYIIYEPAKLVAGKTSVSDAKPKVIEKIVKNLKTRILVGAGIHSKKDIDLAIKLGAHGVAFASAITKVKNPKQKLKEMIK